MSDRLDELKGNVKEGVGKLTGKKRLQGEGASEAQSARTKRRVKGTGQQLAGEVKEGVGKLTGDKGLEGKGKSDRVKGESKRLD